MRRHRSTGLTPAPWTSRTAVNVVQPTPTSFCRDPPQVCAETELGSANVGRVRECLRPLGLDNPLPQSGPV